MGDSRIAEITEFYHEEYKKRFGIPYKWKGGKEQKLMQSCLKYFEGIDLDNPIQKMKEAIGKYLKDDGTFYRESAHDLSHFLSNPARWLVIETRVRPLPERIEVGDKVVQEINWGEFKEKFEKAAGENPERFVKGFFYTAPYLKKKDLEKYVYVRQYLLDLVGKERIAKIYESHKLFKEMPKASGSARSK